MKKIAILLTMWLAALAPLKLAAQSSGSSPLEAKLALENSLEKRLTMILSEALGTEDIIVIISAEMQEQQGKKAAFEIMPGIPEKEKMGEISISNSLTMVKKISANIILDKSVSEEDTKLAVKLAAGLLGLPPERQDLINIEKMSFRKAKPLTVADMMAPPNIWNLAWVVLASVLLVSLVFAFFSPLAKSARSFVEVFNSKSFVPAAPEGGEREEVRERAADKEQAERQQAAAATADGKKPPFWFLAGAKPSNLAFIMKTRPAEDLTIVLSYSPEDLATALAEALYPASVEALAALPSVKLLPEEKVRKLEAELQSALDFVVGGEDKALNILNKLDESVQDKALAAFGKIDPAMSKKLGASVVKFSDVGKLEQAQAQMLARRVPIRVLAAALKTSSFVEAYTAQLTAGMQERFRQELDLTRAIPGHTYKAERAQVVAAIRQLMAEGFIGNKQETAAAVAAKKPLPHIAGLPPLPGGVPLPGKPPAAGAPTPHAPAAAMPPLHAAPGAAMPAAPAGASMPAAPAPAKPAAAPAAPAPAAPKP